jgi:hypothetical protein
MMMGCLRTPRRLYITEVKTAGQSHAWGLTGLEYLPQDE